VRRMGVSRAFWFAGAAVRIRVVCDGSGPGADAGYAVALTILQIDRGAELLRQQGESPLERFGATGAIVAADVRQNDVAVKYTSWSLAFILPDTTLAVRRIWRISCGERLQAAAAVGLDANYVERGNCRGRGQTRVRQRRHRDGLINRARFSIEEARKRGGDTVVALETPKST